MHKERLTKSVGYLVRLQPPAEGTLGEIIDTDWLIANVTDDAVALEHVQSKAVAHIGLDAIYSYMTDVQGRRTPTEKRGFLQVRVRIVVHDKDNVSVTPLPAPGVSSPPVSPIDNETARIAKQHYSGYWLGARFAIRALIEEGEMTSDEMFHCLNRKHEGSDGPDLLRRLAAQSPAFVRPAQPDDTREVKLLGYNGRYMINPTFRTALERLVAADPELRRYR